MKKLHFSTMINTSREKVWDVLWSDATYRQWTSVFSEGSHAVTDWNEGSKVLFLDPKGEGMVSTIAKKIPNEYMAFRHLGVVRNGKEAPLDEETKKWAGAMETYTLKQSGNKTELLVDLDISDEEDTNSYPDKDYFSTVFPKALERLKALCEGQASST